MGIFNLFSMTSSQQSLQQEMNTNMLTALQKQLANTTWPNARNQLIAQINQIQSQQQMTQPNNNPNPQPQQQSTNNNPIQPVTPIQPQAPSPALSQAPSQQTPPQAPQPSLRRQEIEAELSNIKTSIARIEGYMK